MNNNEWQPIETAPKDGTIIIGFVPKPDDIYSGVCDVKWIEEEYQEINGIKYKFGGHFGKPSYNNVVVRPSHWIPLPETPKPPML